MWLLGYVDVILSIDLDVRSHASVFHTFGDPFWYHLV